MFTHAKFFKIKLMYLFFVMSTQMVYRSYDIKITKLHIDNANACFILYALLQTDS